MRRRCMHRVVDGEFHHWQEFAPIRKRMDITPKDFLKNAVCTFCLTICFRVVRGRHLKARSECFEHGSPELAVNRGSRLETSSRGNPLGRKIVSIKIRAHADALIDSGTATRCIILLNLLTNTRIPVSLCGSAESERWIKDHDSTP